MNDQQKRAIDEYKKNTPPLIKQGQGRKEIPEGDELIEAVAVLIFTFIGLAAFLFICYLGKGVQ